MGQLKIVSIAVLSVILSACGVPEAVDQAASLGQTSASSSADKVSPDANSQQCAPGTHVCRKCIQGIGCFWSCCAPLPTIPERSAAAAEKPQSKAGDGSAEFCHRVCPPPPRGCVDICGPLYQ